MTKTSDWLQSLTHRIIKLPTWLYLSLIGALGLFARLIYVVKADIWHDEGYTMMLIKHGPLDIIARTARDVHPPLYYLAAHAWQLIFGDSVLAVRSLSVVFGIAIIIVAYLLMKRLFSEGTARLAILFVAIGPFVVRYSDEARMYIMAAFFVTLASYLIVRLAAAKLAKTWLWLTYGLVLALGLYTHYYAIFIVPVHIIYLAWQRKSLRAVLADWRWWLGNGLGAVLFLPWVPTVLAQMSRVEAGFWIPPVDLMTLPDTFMQFMSFSSARWSPYLAVMTFVCFALFATGLYTVYRYRPKLRQAVTLLTLWLVLPLGLVVLLSLKQPIYYDRYFIYCAVALYLLIAVIITRVPWLGRAPLRQYGAVLLTCAILGLGVWSVGQQAAHQMGTIGDYVSERYQTGDKIISAELYTFFDFSYYNQTGQPVHLLSSSPLSGYGETSLIYDQADKLVVPSLDDVKTAERVWLVGKAGDHDYYGQAVPVNWTLSKVLEVNGSAVRLYTVSAE